MKTLLTALLFAVIHVEPIQVGAAECVAIAHENGWQVTLVCEDPELVEIQHFPEAEEFIPIEPKKRCLNVVTSPLGDAHCTQWVFEDGTN